MDLAGKTILLTGGTGSFGQAFVEYATTRWPDIVIRVYSRDELKQATLRARHGDRSLRYLIGDVRDKDRLARAAQGVDYIIHAAAMKQVPACEYNPFEAVQTNIVGAQNVVDAAIDAGVSKVIALSTDKAVNPINLYGATKLCAEKIFVHGNAYAGSTDMSMSCVRYGNVLGSRGSIVALLREQESRGEVLITDERMTRFWITLEQAVELVLNALEHAGRGEVVVPKLPSMRLVDLVDTLVPEVPRRMIGIRPGEKLHEVLVTSDESRRTVDVGDVYVIQPEHPWWSPDASSWPSGKPLEDGFEYRSDSNDEWLNRSVLVALANDLG